MSEFVSEPQDGEAPDSSDRRQFLSKSAIMLALVALAQGADPADAAAVDFRGGPATIKASEIMPLNEALDSFIKAGRVDPKNPAFLKLSPASQKALGALSPADLGTLRAAQAIVQTHFSLPNAADNTGTIGM